MNIDQIIDQARKIIIGKDEVIKLALCSYFSRGHLLIEDIPGVGKTTLAKTLARLFNFKFQRIQFTNDLLPSDMIGVQVFNTKIQSFEFHPGPLFTQFLLADELNRASPKTQSALLEAMEERKITVDRQTYKLDYPFFVIATQNPKGQLGTFPLPESQMDRFLMKIQIGPPKFESEVELLERRESREIEDSLKPIVGIEESKRIHKACESVHLSRSLAEYIVHLLSQSRKDDQLLDLSPRAGIDLSKAAKSWAYFSGRDFVNPDDIQKLIPYVWGHRLISPLESSISREHFLAHKLIETVKVP